LSLSFHPEFISQDYRFGFLATIKHNSNCGIGAVFFIPSIPTDSSGPRTGFKGFDGRLSAPPSFAQFASLRRTSLERNRWQLSRIQIHGLQRNLESLSWMFV